jgi:hypothetical protein
MAGVKSHKLTLFLPSAAHGAYEEASIYHEIHHLYAGWIIASGRNNHGPPAPPHKPRWRNKYSSCPGNVLARRGIQILACPSSASPELRSLPTVLVTEAHFNPLVSHYYGSDYVPSHQIMVQSSIAIFATLFIQLALFAQLSTGFPVQYVVPPSCKATLSEINIC